MDRLGKLWLFLPLVAAVALLVVFMLGLQREAPRDLPSTLIDEPVPEFALPGLGDRPGLSAADLRAPGVKLLNVWASWCVPCRAENAYLMMLTAEGVTIHGLNYKDKPADAEAFLAELGNPFQRIGVDRSGRTGIDFGVYGVPETFVINGQGRITYKHIGPILERNIDTFREKIRAAGAAQ